jgi:hypothetical protein
MKQIIWSTQQVTHLSVAAVFVAALGYTSSDAAGPNQKALAVDLSFENLVGAQPNFNVEEFTLIDGELTAFGSITWNVEGAQLPPVAFAVPVLNVSGSCDVVNITIAGLETEFSGTLLSFDEAHFDVYSGDATPNAIRALLCTASHIADAEGNPLALAGALNRILPTIQ